MTKELYLAKDDVRVIFDTKEHCDLLGVPRFGDIVYISDIDYADYCETVVKFYAWQRKLEDMIKSNEATIALGRFM